MCRSRSSSELTASHSKIQIACCTNSAIMLVLATTCIIQLSPTPNITFRLESGGDEEMRTELPWLNNLHTLQSISPAISQMNAVRMSVC